MQEVDLSSTASPLGSVNLGQASAALSSIAQFGIYLEMRKMNLLREAEFEERRHRWIAEITNQWIEEHSDTNGILADVTESVSKECWAMWKQVWENEKVDVPQSLLLRLKRLSEFLDLNYTVAAYANNQLVEATGSDEGWLLDTDVCSKSVANQMLDDAADEPQRDIMGGLLKTLAGIPLIFIPGVGGIAAGFTIGKGLGDMTYTGRMSDDQRERLQDKLSLFQFCIAADRVNQATKQVEYLLNQQQFGTPMRFLVTETAEDEISFLLDQVTPNKMQSSPNLNPVPLPLVLK